MKRKKKKKLVIKNAITRSGSNETIKRKKASTIKIYLLPAAVVMKVDVGADVRFEGLLKGFCRRGGALG
jgi:hypothetical protein